MHGQFPVLLNRVRRIQHVGMKRTVPWEVGLTGHSISFKLRASTRKTSLIQLVHALLFSEHVCYLCMQACAAELVYANSA